MHKVVCGSAHLECSKPTYVTFFFITWIWGLLISKLIVYIVYVFVCPVGLGWHQGVWGTVL